MELNSIMNQPQRPRELKFDQTERITSRLRDLVRNYPKGLGLIKEFLQNADDAGASKLQVIYDRRFHTGPIEPPEMDIALGPSLLFVNDSMFTEEDFERIQNIGHGGKVSDATGTGRFGQGFNTSYSISDHPSLLTGGRIAWFDPHHILGFQGNAAAWELSEVEGHWPAWAKTFLPAGLELGRGSYPGTIFRLPLRTTEHAEQSEIIPEAFENADFESIIHELQDIGPAILVFLRSVTSLEITEISENGNQKLRYKIETTNEQAVNEQKTKLRNVVNGNPKDLLEKWLKMSETLLTVKYHHAFKVTSDENRPKNETRFWTCGVGFVKAYSY